MKKIPNNCEWPGCGVPLGYPRTITEVRCEHEAKGVLVSLCPEHTARDMSPEEMRTLRTVGLMGRAFRRG
jgi:hypothetical protein